MRVVCGCLGAAFPGDRIVDSPSRTLHYRPPAGGVVMNADTHLKPLTKSSLPSGAKSLLIWMALVLPRDEEVRVTVSFGELSEQIKLPRSSVVRHIRTLIQQGWISRMPSRTGGTDTYILNVPAR